MVSFVFLGFHSFSLVSICSREFHPFPFVEHSFLIGFHYFVARIIYFMIFATLHCFPFVYHLFLLDCIGSHLFSLVLHALVIHLSFVVIVFYWFAWGFRFPFDSPARICSSLVATGSLWVYIGLALVTSIFHSLSLALGGFHCVTLVSVRISFVVSGPWLFMGRPCVFHSISLCFVGLRIFMVFIYFHLLSVYFIFLTGLTGFIRFH